MNTNILIATGVVIVITLAVTLRRRHQRAAQQPQEVAVHIHPLDITGLYEGPGGEIYVRTGAGFYRKGKPSRTEFVKAEGRMYAAPTFEPVEDLPDGCKVLSDGPVAQPMSEDEARECGI